MVPKATKKHVSKCIYIVERLDDVVRSSFPTSHDTNRIAMSQTLLTHAAAVQTDARFLVAELTACQYDACFDSCNIICANVPVSQGGSSVNPADFIPRFSSQLLLNRTDMRARVLPLHSGPHPALSPGHSWSAFKMLHSHH